MAETFSYDEPLTAIVQRRIKPGCEARFEALMQDFIGFVLGQPGHIGIYVLRPEHGSQDYTIVDRFASVQARRAFTALPQYRDWQKKLLEVSEAEPVIQEQGGLAGWFTLPDRPVRRPPPRHKMALVTLLGVYPLSMLLPRIVSPLAEEWHSALTGLVISALIVVSLTWVVMPMLTRLFEKWLFKAED